jgi:nicotinamide mononucleotide transporter
MSIFTAQTGAKVTIMDVLELIAAILGAISVYFVVQRNILAFPIGIVMVILYVAVFYRAKFYADMGLQIVYVVLQIQGWYEWSRGDRAADDKIAVRNLSQRQWQITGILLIVGTLCIGAAMQRLTDASLPWIDAFTTTLSLLAQWWMNKKFLENWILWIAVDVVYLYQYSYKALYFTTALYAVFLGLAIWGYFEWKKMARSPQGFQDHQHRPGKGN